jgi:Hydroxymethylglutaryl-coenzyme A synthase N terminal
VLRIFLLVSHSLPRAPFSLNRSFARNLFTAEMPANGTAAPHVNGTNGTATTSSERRPFQTSATARPQNVGIRKFDPLNSFFCEYHWLKEKRTDGMEIYFPSRCISETDLEKFDGVSSGKVWGSRCLPAHRRLRQKALASTPLASVRNTWPSPTTARTSTLSCSPVSVASIPAPPPHFVPFQSFVSYGH